ncbi:HAMP domain-containing histidine kinase, partial [Acidobacteria bacterium AH-259-L09]|nr:HAMP domain-containing histidine kinase [Acidobacteria bacterium AH-259-L09]
EFVNTDLSELIKEILNRYRFHFEKVDIELVEDLPKEPVYSNVDCEAIEQVLINLFSNAMKYIGDGERRVEVSLSVNAARGKIQVADTGIGMSEEQQRHIFNKFYRASENSARSVAGSGIGLTLVRHIVEAHQGEILVESSPKQGSIFTVLLPLSQIEAEA